MNIELFGILLPGWCLPAIGLVVIGTFLIMIAKIDSSQGK